MALLAGALLLILLHRLLHPDFWRALALLAALSALVLALVRLGDPPTTGFVAGWDLAGGPLGQPTFRDGADSRPFALLASLVLAVWTAHRVLAGTGAPVIAKGLAAGAAVLFFLEADDPLSVALAWGGLDLLLLGIALTARDLPDPHLVRRAAVWSLLGLTAWLGAALLSQLVPGIGALRAVALWIRLGAYPAHSLWLLAGGISPGLGGVLRPLVLVAGGGLLVREGWPPLMEPFSAVAVGVALAVVARGLAGLWWGRAAEEGLTWVVQAQLGWLILAVAVGGSRIEELAAPYLLWTALATSLLLEAREAPATAVLSVLGPVGRGVSILGAAALLPAPPLPASAVRGLAYLRIAEAESLWVGWLGALVTVLSVSVLLRWSGHWLQAAPRRQSWRIWIELLPLAALVSGAIVAPLWMGAVPLAGSPLALGGGGDWWVGWAALLAPVGLGYGVHRYGERLPAEVRAVPGTLTGLADSLQVSQRLDAIWSRLSGAVAGGAAALEGRHLTGWLVLAGLGVLILLLD